MAPRPKNLVGQKFHRLTVLEFAGYREGANARHSTFKCRCECGTEVIVAQRHLIGGNTKSCGCIIGQSLVTHGASKTAEYKAWVAMRRRCEDPGHQSFKDYGARGIAVCERWQAFENFIADMGPRPSRLHSLDRHPDNNGNYEPTNCRWATWLQQGRNKRNNRYLTLNGETLTLSEWEQRTGLPKSTLMNRVDAGWSIEETLTRGFSQGTRDVARRLRGEPT